jgi:pimeloyl-ACP methyl ester carboxylesterase
LKQIDAGLLNVGYAEAGPADGPAVILLHGWPYDIHSFVDITPLLASAGYRVIVPYLRGYGSTSFLSGGNRVRGDGEGQSPYRAGCKAQSVDLKGAGGAEGTDDLLKWDQALYGTQVLSEASKRDDPLVKLIQSE